MKTIKNNQNAKDFIKKFFNPNTKRYLFGTNKYALSILNAMNGKIDGFINDFSKDSTFHNVPIIKLDNVPKDGVIVSCVVLSQGLNVKRRLDLAGFNHLDYFAFYKYSNLDICPIDFVNSDEKGSPYTINHAKIHIESNPNHYQKIYDKLSDKISKKQFLQCLDFRTSLDIENLEGCEYTPLTQYFEDFIDYKKIDYFFDIGAYKGESSLEFIKHNKNYKQIYFFEPERKNFNEARENLKDFKHIKGFNIGLGDKKERLMVNSISTSSHLQKVDSPHSMDSMEEADSMDSTQKHYIEVNSLDNLIASGEIILNENILNGGGQQVMLKIDIESSEEFALKGASKLIRDYKPIIAICIYHRFDDFINLPNIIFSIYKDYKLYFRHYSSGLTESVMFFVPKNGG